MNKNAVNTEEAKPEPKDVFSFIAESNKDVKMLLREGDIVIGVGRNAKICEGNTCRWKANSDGIVNVPYTISTNFSAAEVSVIVDAMQDFALLTCVRFVPRTVEPDYVKIINGPGCWSSVGKTVGAQELSLDSNGCVTKGTAQHELNHALGFYHEQSRIDRDNYVKIITENILPGAIGNFDKRNTDNLGQEYDYASIMHYGRNAFAKQSNLNTIVPKPDPTVAIGQRYGLSNLDISKINKLYECGACSNVLSDTTGSLKSSNYPGIYPNNGTCLWLIRVPDGQVFMQFMAFDLQSSTGCASDYLKVYDGGTPSAPVLLAKACGTSQLPSIVSTGNLMLLEFVSDGSIAATGFKASYSTVQCGSAFYSPSGEFSTPNYPSDYPPNTNCSWIIWAPAGYQVSLNMADFYLEYHRSCSYDSLQVFDGPKSTSPLIGRYCTSIPNIVSTGNSLLLQFRSDRQVQNRGFKANYSFVPKKN
ncbi:embryonic protein UVS.2-like isoform X2 [Xenopus laevis]|nr:embryonic protein UVS.2-like isoform X2 [Xenopus laevis]